MKRLAGLLRRLADHLEPPPRLIERGVAERGYPHRPADLQLVHGPHTDRGRC